MRARSGHSCTTVGAVLGTSASKISRIETGRIGLQADEVAALLGFYQAPKPLRDELLELVRRAGGPGWWQVQGSATRAVAGAHRHRALCHGDHQL